MKNLTAESFLYKIWPRSLLRYENLELRAIRRKDNQIRRQFLPSVDDFLVVAQSFGEGWDIYFGVCTRFQTGGRKKDCYRVKSVWIDLDKEELPRFDIQPDIIVRSGSGHHVYWVLENPLHVRTGRWIEIEAINRALAKKYGGDIAAIDVSRILRVPGFNNFKYDPPREVKAYALQA